MMHRFAALVVAMALSWGQPGWARQDDPRLDALFARLQVTSDEIEAIRVEQKIWEIWTTSGDESLDLVMMRGIRAMSERDYAVALVAFNTIVEAAPDFAEGWNKRATLYWLMGDYDASVADIDRTLALEPRHFGALSGLAMIRIAQDRPADAKDALERLVAVNPHAVDARRQLERLERVLGRET
jgi:Flp pilus assembly protein TadD